MNMALGITLMWIGAALLYVAFHPLSGATPGAVIKELQGLFQKQTNAYSSQNTATTASAVSAAYATDSNFAYSTAGGSMNPQAAAAASSSSGSSNVVSV